MEIMKTCIEGVLIIEPKVFGDHRGWFTETYSKAKYAEKGIHVEFLQDNHSMSAQKGTLRGLHFQIFPKAQTKLVRCTKGKILDVAVDLRSGSPTFKKWVSVELSEDNQKQLFIPKGFAHGFLAMTDHVEVQYKVDEYYSPECDRSIRFDDPEIGISWGVDVPVLSKKDFEAPLLRDGDVRFEPLYMVTGASGQLGHDIVKNLHERKHDVIAPEMEEFDLTNQEQIRAYILERKPDVIIHCAAYTAVDKAESEKELCYSVNVEGTRSIAQAANEIDAKLVYISTDYVFDGNGQEASPEEKETNPVNYYGYTKEQGEQIVRKEVAKHFIIRTSWVYGINGANFVKKMIDLAKQRREISVVGDQIGAPTYTRDLATRIIAIAKTDFYGTYHGVNDGFCSWYEFARSIFGQSGIEVQVNEVLTNEYPTQARRPLNSKLSVRGVDVSRFGRMPHWTDALTRFLAELQDE